MQTTKRHMSLNISGFLRNHKGKSIEGIFNDDNGNPVSDSVARVYLKECQDKGWNLIPMCPEEECPDFNHVEGGCPGHPADEPKIK